MKFRNYKQWSDTVTVVVAFLREPGQEVVL